MRLIKSLARRAKAKGSLEFERAKRGQHNGLIYGAMTAAAVLLVVVVIFDAAAGIGLQPTPSIQRATAW